MKKFVYVLIGCYIAFAVACSYPERITDGTTAYKRKQYAVAAKMFSKEFEKGKTIREKGQKAYLAGKSYEWMNDDANALLWYKKAYDNQYGAKALIEQAQAQKRNQDYLDAAKSFELVGQLTGETDKYKQEAKACTKAAEWLAALEENDYKVETVDVNSGFADYAPFLLDENTLVFSSDRGTSAGKDKYKWTGAKFSDLYQADLKSNSVSPLSLDLNSEYNEGAACFDSQGNTVYFTRCGADGKQGIDYCRIVSSKKTREGSWTKPKILPFVQGKYNYAHPMLADDNTLYFASNRPGTLGKSDLFYVTKTDDGWGEPINLGRGVNTAENEKFPFIENDTIYFASDGHAGMGGLDIFRSVIEKNRFRKVENMKAPINSGGDDFALFIERKRENLPEGIDHKGYFSSTRKDGKGKDDIYAFSKKIVIPPPVIVEPPVDTVEAPPAIVYEFNLEGVVMEKVYQNPDDPNSQVTGTRALPDAKVRLITGGQTSPLEQDNNAKFTSKLQAETRYTVTASKPGYFTKSKFITTDEKDENNPIRTYKVELVLDKIFKDKEITLDDIYYDYDKWDIRPDAEIPLNKLVRILQENPDIRIQLSSHTDCRGGDDYNKTLSQKRAQSAVDYLIRTGIAPTRLVAVGYGEEAPAINCRCTQCTEEEHQANRRTTFKVID